MPVKNRESFIDDAFKCIEQQNINDLQLIIVDDDSTDNTLDKCNLFLEKKTVPTKILQTKNAGPAKARNLALEISDSQLITFLDSDDWWPTNRLKTHLEAYTHSSKSEVILGQTKLIADSKSRQNDFHFKADCLHFPSLAAATFKQSVFDKVGMLDPMLKFGEDTDFFFRIREQSILIFYLNTISLYYRLHDSNMTKNKSPQELSMFRVLRQSLHRRHGRALSPIGKNKGSRDE